MTRSASDALVRAILLATLVAGTLDIGAAILTNPQVPARVVLQSVAGGWLGDAAYGGGWPTAWLGLGSHFAVMLGIAAVFMLTAARLPALRRLWFPVGVAFGITVWAAMTFVVVPLSASTLPPPDSVMAAMKPIVIHILCVGLPIAWIARRVLGPPAVA
ncbi:hypothetical protein N0B44_30850 [Roseibacterium beibuensis]|uniref:hypothetical protein n=1 Tax=[Roseibacterium] beibuensis TaxID=1193142 RepID=UPI00217CF308|nr:hypothetical protein [Roseibacterium beibuensis]MCS6627315.1 hypothetical protein [Roseibacterium beibuensis]